MSAGIRFGGTLVIGAILLVMLFLISEVIPLFASGRVEKRSSHILSIQSPVVAILGDDFGELPGLILEDGQVFFLDTVHAEDHLNRGLFSIPYAPKDKAPSVVMYNRRDSSIILGLESGQVMAVNLEYEVDHGGERQRVVRPNLTALPPWQIGDPSMPITEIGYGNSGQRRLVVTAQNDGSRKSLRAALVEEPRTLLSSGEPLVAERFNLDRYLSDDPIRQILVPFEANGFLTLSESGEVRSFFLEPGGKFALRQRFYPFSDSTGDVHLTGESGATAITMEFVRGDYSIVFGARDGRVVTYGLYRDSQEGGRRWDRAHEFMAMDGPITNITENARNKVFLVGTPSEIALQFNTSATTRAHLQTEYQVDKAALNPRYSNMFVLDKDGTFHLYDIDDPHPQGSLRSFFSKIQYEGQSSSEFYWQSSGATNDFEPKLSMVPLVAGTLKGTLYSMLFSLPIAILGALYTSQFLHPGIRAVVKPTMEMMASIPSVVLGFLGALWLAPLLADSVPSVVGVLLFSLAGTLLMAVFVSHDRSRVSSWYQGYEFALLLPVLALCIVGGWWAGATAEQLLFKVTDPESGMVVSDFRLWITNVLGIGFEQRNQLVVGFAMGFAVIPLIYTISEDALSNVPQSLSSGSLALGASRWQTAIKVVLPTAAAGIFSAIMIGLGRAVGETMIVVMATGNVPTTDLNIFTGMRTLSAGIAVELPEASHRGTLYRSLFLGALLLFGFTFILNTVAELFRQRLRSRYQAME